ncbi:MAG TPA: YraN family protein [Candidatus Paceibacterota bacterium]|nr:YraN family protein [Candidatus Paceibacterota bacterium]
MPINLPKDPRKAVGDFGENLAARFLEEKGYRILMRNYHQPWGEIDLIAEKEGKIVFCEVKTNSRDFGRGFKPEVRVDQRKAWQIIKSAELFLAKFYPEQAKEWRIDIIAVTILKAERKARLTHFKNAVTGQY